MSAEDGRRPDLEEQTQPEWKQLSAASYPPDSLGAIFIGQYLEGRIRPSTIFTDVKVSHFLEPGSKNYQTIGNPDEITLESLLHQRPEDLPHQSRKILISILEKHCEKNKILPHAQLVADAFGVNAQILPHEVEAEVREAVSNGLEILPERYRKIIEVHYGLINGRPISFRDMGKDAGVTPSWIQQLSTKSLKRLYDYGELEQYVALPPDSVGAIAFNAIFRGEIHPELSRIPRISISLDTFSEGTYSQLYRHRMYENAIWINALCHKKASNFSPSALVEIRDVISAAISKYETASRAPIQNNLLNGIDLGENIQAIANVRLSALDLPKRVWNALFINGNVITVRDLLSLDPKKLGGMNLIGVAACMHLGTAIQRRMRRTDLPEGFIADYLLSLTPYRSLSTEDLQRLLATEEQTADTDDE